MILSLDVLCDHKACNPVQSSRSLPNGCHLSSSETLELLLMSCVRAWRASADARREYMYSASRARETSALLHVTHDRIAHSNWRLQLS